MSNKILYSAGIKPFTVPGNVLITEKKPSSSLGYTIHDVKELSEEALRALCVEFTEAVLKRAGYAKS